MPILLSSGPEIVQDVVLRLWVMKTASFLLCLWCIRAQDLAVPFSRGREMLLTPVIIHLHRNHRP